MRAVAVTDAQLRELVAAWNTGMTKAALAAKYDRSASWVESKLVDARNRGMVVRRRGRSHDGEITEADTAQVIACLNAGIAVQHIALQLNLPRAVCRQIRDQARDNFLLSAARDASARGALKSPHAIRTIAGMPISLPYLRCLDPEARA